VSFACDVPSQHKGVLSVCNRRNSVDSAGRPNLTKYRPVADTIKSTGFNNYSDTNRNNTTRPNADDDNDNDNQWRI